MKKTYSIISHTHWDREWYLPFEQFRIRLVDMMDNLLEILETDDGYRFHLDAQTIVIEDYLEIRPHKKADIEKIRPSRQTFDRTLVCPERLSSHQRRGNRS